MDGVEEQLESEPGLGIKEIYEEATPYILRLQVNTDDANAIAELKNTEFQNPGEERFRR